MEGWPGWVGLGILVKHRDGIPANGHPSHTNRARRRATTLIETNPLPLSQAATTRLTGCPLILRLHLFWTYASSWDRPNHFNPLQHHPIMSFPDSGGSRGGAVGAIAPRRLVRQDWFFHQFSAIFYCQLDFFLPSRTFKPVRLPLQYYINCNALSSPVIEVYEKSAAWLAWTHYRNISWFLPLMLWKMGGKHRRFVTVF